ncbi:hypothetical protein [Methyloversatilis sp.]|uniref:hypothetical protein n=1 Tax=Methyloversatilis sp. TaxID=2569862 RepID=UPI002735E02E|nr:hypothetical protein [Methyloversatilis sp.]MDP2868360.1 hypothetical protein [Methyloversatilis sp.]MDP3454193.1 hypothetical protein [Methyloversatilis sp.]MDP3578359.1 hypothetical protein [Methyloversatilis sp.]
MFEIRHHSLRRFLGKLHECLRLFQQGKPSLRAITQPEPGFDLPVQVFIRVEFRLVRRQVKHFDFLPVLFKPSGNRSGVMKAQDIQYQKNLAGTVGNATLQESDHLVRVHYSFNEFEPHRSMNADGQNQCQSVSLARSRQHGCLIQGRVGSQPVSVLGHGRLGAPVDCVLHGLSARHNLRVGLVEPTLDFERVLFQRALYRPLWRVAPMQQVLSRGADPHIDTS